MSMSAVVGAHRCQTPKTYASMAAHHYWQTISEVLRSAIQMCHTKFSDRQSECITLLTIY